MKLLEDGTLLRIFIGETDKRDGKPLYEQIVLKAIAMEKVRVIKYCRSKEMSRCAE
jgi:PII-like signaling protein